MKELRRKGVRLRGSQKEACKGHADVSNRGGKKEMQNRRIIRGRESTPASQVEGLKKTSQLNLKRKGKRGRKSRQGMKLG